MVPLLVWRFGRAVRPSCVVLSDEPQPHDTDLKEFSTRNQ